MISENLRAKIRKLFDMAKMGTGNEAEVAMKLIRDLMNKHGITRDDIELFTADIPMSKRKERWLSMLAQMCAEFSGVVSLKQRTAFVFAGDEIGVNVAHELYFYLKNEIERQLQKTGFLGRKLKNDFRLGCICGLYEKMQTLGGWRDMREKRDLIEKRFFPNIKSVPQSKQRYVDDKSFKTGKRTGADINVSRQAGTAARAGLISGVDK